MSYKFLNKVVKYSRCLVFALVIIFPLDFLCFLFTLSIMIVIVNHNFIVICFGFRSINCICSSVHNYLISASLFVVKPLLFMFCFTWNSILTLFSSLGFVELIMKN